MTWIYVDATTIIALGTIGELELLKVFSGTTVVLPAVRAEVTTQPAEANLKQFCEQDVVATAAPLDGGLEEYTDRARSILNTTVENGDVVLVAAVLGHTDIDEQVAVVSDDRRVRTIGEGLGATVTGTIGVIVRAVEEGRPKEEAKAILRQVDSHGLHLTAELRETAAELIEEASE